MRADSIPSTGDGYDHDVFEFSDALGSYIREAIPPSQVAFFENALLNSGQRESVLVGLSVGLSRSAEQSKDFPGVHRNGKAPVNSAGSPAPHRITSFTVAELLEIKLPEPRHIVPGIFSEGCTIWGGKAKIGKTFAALNIGLAVATGGKAFGHIQVERGRVLYLALEGTNKNLQHRIRSMLCGDVPPDNFHIERVWSTGAAAVDSLREWMDTFPDTKLIVVDTIKAIRGSGSSRKSAYDLDYEELKPLADFCEEYDVSALLLHHTNKAEWDDPFDTISGSMGLRGAVDNEAVLLRDPNGKGVVLHAQGRDQERIEKLLKFDPTILTWILQGDVDEIQSNDQRQLIYRILKSHAPTALSPAKIFELAKARGYDKDSSALRHMLGTMVKDDTTGVTKEGNGLYTVDPRRFARGVSTPSHTSQASQEEGNTGHTVKVVNPVKGVQPIDPSSFAHQVSQMASHDIPDRQKI